MGLCLGFSGMSLVELIYFLTIRAWWYYQKQQKDSGKKSEDTSKDATADLMETSGSEASPQDRYSEISNDDGPIFTRRNLDFTKGGSEPPRISIEDECSTFVELE